MIEVEVDLTEALTSKACSKLVIHLMKYILFNFEQIPLNYDSLYCLLKKYQMAVGSAAGGEDPCSVVNTFGELKVKNLYKTVDLFFNTCEKTFETIEDELRASRGIKELVVMVGSTILTPKKIVRISIPNMPLECENDHPVSRNLHSLCQSIIMSDAVFDYFKERVGPTNVFVFLKMLSGSRPKTELFLPKEDFNFSRIGKQIKINLEQPKSNKCPCLELANSSESSQSSENKDTAGTEEFMEDVYTWYQSKVSLKGLRECKDSTFCTMLNNLVKNAS